MSYTVFYFSGTGNSRYAARRVSERTGGELVSVNDMLKNNVSGPVKTGEDIVLAAPVYAWRIPRVVENWLTGVKLEGAQRIWFILTCGSEIGNAQAYNRRLAKTLGLQYMGTAGLLMPCNHITMFPVPDRIKALEIVAEAEPALNEAAGIIAMGKPLHDAGISPADEARSALVNPMFYPVFIKSAPFRVKDDCISCGKCAEICPLNNITLQNGRPQWGKNCTHCLGCINYCPVEAVEYGRKTRGKSRYHLD